MVFFFSAFRSIRSYVFVRLGAILPSFISLSSIYSLTFVKNNNSLLKVFLIIIIIIFIIIMCLTDIDFKKIHFNSEYNVDKYIQLLY